METATVRYCAQPGGVDVTRGEAEIVVIFPEADQYGHLGQRATVCVELDTQTARHLADRLMKICGSEEQELMDRVDAERIVLARTGDAPLEFRGRPLTDQFTSRQHGNGGPGQNRWHEARIWRTDGGRLVVWVGYRTIWQGERDRDTVEVTGTPDDVARVLRDYDVVEDVAGYPASEVYAERQERLLAAIRHGYDELVGQLLSAAGQEFIQRID